MPTQINIDGVIGIDTTTAAIRAALASAGDVELRIHSPGGSAYDGIAIHNLLAEHRRIGRKVTATIDGLSASAASYIAAAAEHISVPANAVWMVHRPAALVLGDASDCQAVAEQLAAVEAILVDGYTRKTGRDRAEIAAEVLAETWLYGQQIIDSGYADELIPSTDSAPSDRAQALALAKGAFADATAALKQSGQTLDPQRIAALIGRPITTKATAPEDAATAERERIRAVFAQRVPGYDKLIEQLAFDGRSTAADAAMAILERERELRAHHMAAIEATPPAVDACTAPEPGTARSAPDWGRILRAIK